MNTTRLTLIVLFVAVVCVSVGVLQLRSPQVNIVGSWTKSTPSRFDDYPPAREVGRELLNARRDNPVAFARRPDGFEVLAKGRVDRIDPDGRVLVISSTLFHRVSGVVCQASLDQAAGLQRRQRVWVSGSFAGFRADSSRDGYRLEAILLDPCTVDGTS